MRLIGLIFSNGAAMLSVSDKYDSVNERTSELMKLHIQGAWQNAHIRQLARAARGIMFYGGPNIRCTSVNTYFAWRYYYCCYYYYYYYYYDDDDDDDLYFWPCKPCRLCPLTWWIFLAHVMTTKSFAKLYICCRVISNILYYIF